MTLRVALCVESLPKIKCENRGGFLVKSCLFRNRLHEPPSAKLFRGLNTNGCPYKSAAASSPQRTLVWGRINDRNQHTTNWLKFRRTNLLLVHHLRRAHVHIRNRIAILPKFALQQRGLRWAGHRNNQINGRSSPTDLKIRHAQSHLRAFYKRALYMWNSCS